MRSGLLSIVAGRLLMSTMANAAILTPIIVRTTEQNDVQNGVPHLSLQITVDPLAPPRVLMRPSDEPLAKSLGRLSWVLSPTDWEPARSSARLQS